ncbi:MAG TPA: hypothetical protein DCZ06_03220 [Alphaproteobacteria bacterium]|nr:hypothetical protein [Alphaproteobacteria bacterium]
MDRYCAIIGVGASVGRLFTVTVLFSAVTDYRSGQPNIKPVDLLRHRQTMSITHGAGIFAVAESRAIPYKFIKSH